MLSLKKEKFNRKKDTQRLVMESCTRVINTFKFYHAGSSVMVYSISNESIFAQNNVLRQRGTSDAKRCSCQLNISFPTNFKKGADK